MIKARGGGRCGEKNQKQHKNKAKQSRHEAKQTTKGVKATNSQPGFRMQLVQLQVHRA